MKRKLALTVGVLSIGVLSLAGCSGPATTESVEPSRADACSSMTEVYAPAVDSMQLVQSAGSKDAADVHLSAIEDVLEVSAEVDGPAEFIELRDAVVDDTRTMVDESRKTLAGDGSGIDKANAELLESLSDLDRYCAG